MNGLANFREINSFEKKIILHSLSTISPKILQILYDLQNFLCISFKENYSKNNYPVIFLIEKGQKEIVELLNDKSIVYSVGLYFGFIKRSNFYLSLEGAEFLHAKKIFPEFQQLFLNKKGEKSFLYGNNISRNMIDMIPQKVKKKDILLVLNNFNEIIGISQSQFDEKIIHTLKPKDIIAINLSDKGFYLRKTQ